MNGFVGDIGSLTLENTNFRRVIFTAPHSQLVLMSLKPGEDIGEETHDQVDQFFRVEKGNGKVVLNGEESEIREEFAVVVPAGTRHNVINTGEEEMKLYTIYSPANHKDGVIHMTKSEAMADESDHV